MKTGILATGITPPELLGQHGSYADMFEALLGKEDPEMSFEVFDVRDDHFPESIEGFDAWVITGSRCGVYDDLPWMQRLKGLIKEIYAAGQPMVGICFGHQIVASAFGAKVQKYDGGWGVGLNTYRVEGEHGFVDSGEPDSFTINAMHQDQVLELPENASLFASSDFCQYAGLVYDDRILTLQAHPEFNNPFERELVASRRGPTVPEAVADKALAGLETGQQPESERVARWMVRFLKGRK
ncbi:glutamine amidotransferase-related protein [Marinobacterium mangrovicola]|uniref:GMP synthase-like glutamine amidotransferase n=1 Tax=Marinobacterium mangrovicola TaxID=1476959 RepID=A0A4R1GG50_9GAMM|nr:glutamine amidotransferase [Marinobacterium mangrovicola]TCK07427.1 GMP synthase-like glutamine amidotransferase [Marinobacterium mangrovicola]